MMWEERLSPPPSSTTQYCNDFLPRGNWINSTGINRPTLYTVVSRRLGRQYLSAVAIQESNHRDSSQVIPSDSDSHGTVIKTIFETGYLFTCILPGAHFRPSQGLPVRNKPASFAFENAASEAAHPRTPTLQKNLWSFAAKPS